MYGLTTKFREQPMPIRKPWRVACLNTCLPSLLNKTCDHSHIHAPCVGRETLFTQGYTPEICRIIHEAIQKDMRGFSVHLKSAVLSSTYTSAPAVSLELPSGASASSPLPLRESPKGAKQPNFVTVSYHNPVAVFRLTQKGTGTVCPRDCITPLTRLARRHA